MENGFHMALASLEDIVATSLLSIIQAKLNSSQKYLKVKNQGGHLMEKKFSTEVPEGYTVYLLSLIQVVA